MSQKRKRGLHDSLSNIINRQNAPIDEKTKMSASLLAIFAPAEKDTSSRSAESPLPHPEAKIERKSSRPQKLTVAPSPQKSQTVPAPNNASPALFETAAASVGESNVRAHKPFAESLPLESDSFAEFSARWRAFLRPAQLAICQAIWGWTHAIGEEKCFSSMTKLAAAASLSERQCYRTVEQLERRGFIERPEIFNTAQTKGTVFILHLSPIQPSVKAKRIYHIGE